MGQLQTIFMEQHRVSTQWVQLLMSMVGVNEVRVKDDQPNNQLARMTSPRASVKDDQPEANVGWAYGP